MDGDRQEQGPEAKMRTRCVFMHVHTNVCRGTVDLNLGACQREEACRKRLNGERCL